MSADVVMLLKAGLIVGFVGWFGWRELRALRRRDGVDRRP